MRLSTVLFFACSAIALGTAVPLGKAVEDIVLVRDPELNPDLFEGDILGIDPNAILLEPRNAVVDSSLLWPSGIIYYTVRDALSQVEQSTLDAAFKAYADNTCLRMVPRTNERNYIEVQKTGGGCYSYVGMQGGRQVLSLDPSCYRNGEPGSVIHEFMHASGFHHEQSRTDRDDFVYVNYTNIQPGKENNFAKYDTSVITDLGTKYDYGSVLHYGAYGFAVDPSVPTIVAPQPIGQRVGFSQNDIDKLNILYKCAAE